MTLKAIASSRHIAMISIAAFSLAAIAPTVASANDRGQTPNIMAYSLTQSDRADTNRAFLPSLDFRTAQRGTGDEIEDCMNNPTNADQEYIERLGNCFCLATNSTTGGCAP